MFRFTRQSLLRRPTDLVTAHPEFKGIYETLSKSTAHRPRDYRPVLGDLNPTWSLTRESVLVSVLMELVAAGILPREKLDLDEFINPRPIPFIE